MANSDYSFFKTLKKAAGQVGKLALAAGVTVLVSNETREILAQVPVIGMVLFVGVATLATAVLNWLKNGVV